MRAMNHRLREVSSRRPERAESSVAPARKDQA